MDAVKSLDASSGSLKFAISKQGWSKVFVISGGPPIKIGEDSFRSIASKFAEFFRARHLHDSGGESARWQWIASFVVLHGSLYARRTEAGLIIMAQDKRAQAIAEFTVSAQEEESWLQIVKEWEAELAAQDFSFTSSDRR